MRRTRRANATLSVSAAAVAVALGVTLTGCGAGSDDSGTVEDDHVNAAQSGSFTETPTEEDAPDPTVGDAPAEGSLPEPSAPAPGGSAPAPGPAPAPAPAPEEQQLPLGDYTVNLSPDKQMVCGFREDQEADGYDWGCQANFHTVWPATEGGDANGVAYRQGGDPELYALLGNIAGLDIAGDLQPGSVTQIGGRFTVDLSEPDAALITADGTTTRVTQESYELV
ncbi:MAG: hypothetical protein ACTH1D_07135 [Mycobacteriaceae bacterium]|uniref:hypothetical protein n=1 Tax=Corynebacterium sp. TaxID=1720 RepID=UPI003F952779